MIVASMSRFINNSLCYHKLELDKNRWNFYCKFFTAKQNIGNDSLTSPLINNIIFQPVLACKKKSTLVVRKNSQKYLVNSDIN